jgi:hypothetical protein
MTTDKEHLQWMLNRLVEVHGENRNVDYMMRTQKIIDSTETELNLHLVSKPWEVGSMVEITDNKFRHQFEIGEKVEIVNIDTEASDIELCFECVGEGDENTWWISKEEANAC